MVAVRNEDVARRDVAMDQALGVRSVECARNLLDDRHGSRRGKGPLLPDERREIGAIDQPHEDVEPTLGFPGIEHLDDVRVLDGSCQPPLPLEPLAEALVFRQARREELEGTQLAQLHVARPVDDAHPALADERLDPVPGDDAPDQAVVVGSFRGLPKTDERPL